MANHTAVTIGIQARSTSTRFPGKVFQMIGDEMLLQHVINRAKGSARYINNETHRNGILVTVCLLIPKGDEIGRLFKEKALVIEGDETDVLSRYLRMADRMKSDFIVRLTGDCPLIPSSLISKHIRIAIKNDYDYFSNVDESCRTAPDGHDVEVFSRRVLDHLNFSAKGIDREHVTTLIRREKPEWAKVGHLVNEIDLSSLKISVDTPEDLERVRRAWLEPETKVKTAIEKSGKSQTHRY